MTLDELRWDSLEWIDNLLSRSWSLRLSVPQKRVLIALRALVAADDHLVKQVHARLQVPCRVEEE